jgi:hypothetical protein
MRQILKAVVSITYASVTATWTTLAVAGLLTSLWDMPTPMNNWTGVLISLLWSLVYSLGMAGIAIPFGFIGAATTLSLFLIPSASRRSLKATVILGGMAGLVHTSIGWCLRLADQQLPFGHPWDSHLTSIGIWGGFLLTNTSLVMAYATIPASIVAGCAAGYVFFRVTQGQAPIKTTGSPS